MLQTGDKVIYGVHGICCVTGTEAVSNAGKSRTYYVLQPINQDGSRYLLPTDNEAALSRVFSIISAAEWEKLLESSEVHTSRWLADENQRKLAYRELTAHGSRAALLSMLFTLYDNRQKQRQAGRKIHICDDIFLRDTEKMLAEEVACVLDISMEDARSYLQNKLKGAIET